jgi:hypothetical protein
MIYPHSPDNATYTNFCEWLREIYPDNAENLIQHMTGDTGAIVVLHDDVKFENHIVCVFGSMSFVEVYKQLTPTNFRKVRQNDRDLPRFR